MMIEWTVLAFLRNEGSLSKSPDGGTTKGLLVLAGLRLSAVAPELPGAVRDTNI